jgi:hypothetical protein
MIVEYSGSPEQPNCRGMHGAATNSIIIGAQSDLPTPSLEIGIPFVGKKHNSDCRLCRSRLVGGPLDIAILIHDFKL